jgi:hypothetical protein
LENFRKKWWRVSRIGHSRSRKLLLELLCLFHNARRHKSTHPHQHAKKCEHEEKCADSPRNAALLEPSHAGRKGEPEGHSKKSENKDRPSHPKEFERQPDTYHEECSPKNVAIGPAAGRSGTRTIESVLDEPTMKLMAEKGAWLSTQPWELTDFGKPATGQEEKGKPLVGAWQRVLKLAKQYKVRVAYGTDLLFDPTGTYKQNEMLTRLAQIYSNVEALKIATSGNCELFALSGEPNPYKKQAGGNSGGYLGGHACGRW